MAGRSQSNPGKSTLPFRLSTSPAQQSAAGRRAAFPTAFSWRSRSRRHSLSPRFRIFSTWVVRRRETGVAAQKQTADGRTLERDGCSGVVHHEQIFSDPYRNRGCHVDRGARRRCVHAIGRPGWRGRLPFWLRRPNPTSLALDPLAPVKDVPSKNTLIGAFTPQVIGIGAVLRSDVARSGAIV